MRVKSWLTMLLVSLVGMLSRLQPRLNGDAMDQNGPKQSVSREKEGWYYNGTCRFVLDRLHVNSVLAADMGWFRPGRWLRSCCLELAFAKDPTTQKQELAPGLLRVLNRNPLMALRHPPARHITTETCDVWYLTEPPTLQSTPDQQGRTKSCSCSTILPLPVWTHESRSHSPHGRFRGIPLSPPALATEKGRKVVDTNGGCVHCAVQSKHEYKRSGGGGGGASVGGSGKRWGR